MTLYRRTANDSIQFWTIWVECYELFIKYGIVGKTSHIESIQPRTSRVSEVDSRTKAKRKEGYKALIELRDNITEEECNKIESDTTSLINYLNTYLPKHNTTSEGFVLPMLAKTLENNKPFDDFGDMLGQYKINGLRCLIGATKTNDMFKPIKLTYHSREGADWTHNLTWMDDIILPKLHNDVVEAMVEEGAMLDGELYIPNLPVNNINSIVKTPNTELHRKLQFWWYDIAIDSMSVYSRNELRKKSTCPYIIPFTKQDHYNNKEQFVMLKSVFVDNVATATSFRDRFIELGFEGLILRNPNSEYLFGKRSTKAMFKYKKVDDGLFQIMAINADRKGLPVFVLKNDINGALFECTINLPHSKQMGIMANKEVTIADNLAFVEYRERSGVHQVPFHAKIIKLIKK